MTDLSQEIRDAVRMMIEADIAHLPKQLGIDHIVPGCEVVNVDTYGVGTGTLPRYITVKINEYHLPVLYRGGILTLAVGSSVSVAHLSEGDRYEVIGPSGASGTVSPGHTPRAWLSETPPYMDFHPDKPAVVTSTGSVTEYDTINNAITAASSGDWVVVPPGTYNENIVLRPGIPVVELFTDTVTISTTSGNYAVSTSTDSGNYTISVYRIEMRNAVITTSGICAVYAQHASDSTLYCYANLYCYNTETNVNATAIGLHHNSGGNLYFRGDIEVISDGDHYGTYAVRNSTTGSIDGAGNIRSFAWHGFGYGLRNQSTGSIKWRGDIYVYTEGEAEQEGYSDTGYAVGIQNRGGDIDYIGNITAHAHNSDAGGIGCHSGGGTIYASGRIHAIGSARGIAGISCNSEDVSTDLYFHGAVKVETQTNGVSVYGVQNLGTGTWTVDADVVVSTPTTQSGGGAYAVRNSGEGSVYAITGRASATAGGGDAEEYDLYQSNGYLYISSIQYDTYYGTVSLLTESIHALIAELEDPTDLVISSNAITVTQSYHTVDTEGGGSEDEIETINGGVVGRILVIRSKNNARTIAVRHNTGNIWLAGGIDVTLNDTNIHLTLVYNGSKWCSVGFVNHAHSDNVILVANSAPNWQDMFGGVYLGDCTAAPTGNPASGVFIYSDSGAAKCRGGGGTVTTFGPSEPHCPVCGSDYMTEFENEKYGYLAVCMNCLANELGERPWILRSKR